MARLKIDDERLALAAPRRGALALAGLLATACPSAPKEGPPPAESYEIASAAPHALGALGGGTEAAPHAILKPGAARLAPDEAAPEPDEDEDGGIAPVPDAGAGPEDVPL
jgi:hypothetical protein